MNRRSYVCFCLIILLITLLSVNQNPAWSSDHSSFNVTGYIKPLFTLTDLKSLDLRAEGNSSVEQQKIEASLANTFRTSLNWMPDNFIRAEVAYELAPIIQNPDIAQSSIEIKSANPLSYRVYDLGKTIDVFQDGSDIQLIQNLDRLLITLSPEFADIHIGRQPIAFGSARVINPTDILTSFAYVELNKEERIGIDAIRIQYPIGSLSEIDLGVVFSDDFSAKESASFLRGRFSITGSDISPVAIVFRQNLLLGLDIASSLGDAGVWVESAYVFANIIDDHISGQDYLRFSTGLDYSFTESLYAYAEYHFNEAGDSDPDDYQDLLFRRENDIAYNEGAVYLLGKHYLAPGVSYQATPLITLIAQALYNINDSSVLLFPDFQYSISDDAVLEAGAFIGLGKGNEIVRNVDTGLIRISTNAEFSLYADTYFISAKFYY